MSKFIFLILLFSFNVQGRAVRWIVKENIKNPESVYYDKTNDLIFVSNIDGGGDKKDGNGHISLLSPKGKLLESFWVKDLNAPKGMRSNDNTLYVSDIDELVEIDIKKRAVIKKYKIEGAKFLNDIAIDYAGNVYVSDTLTSKIHVLKNGKISTFVEGDKYESPNGLLYYKEELYVAAWGLTTDWSTKVNGRLYKINLKSKDISYISKEPLGHLDGLERTKEGNFIVSDWSAGSVYEITPKGKTKKIHQGPKGLADIGWIQDKGILLVPLMKDNKIEGI